MDLSSAVQENEGGQGDHAVLQKVQDAIVRDRAGESIQERQADEGLRKECEMATTSVGGKRRRGWIEDVVWQVAGTNDPEKVSQVRVASAAVANYCCVGN